MTLNQAESLLIITEMKTIYNIAKTELKVLFYSPVAWLILVIFTFQSAAVFTGSFSGQVRVQQMGYPLHQATIFTYAGWGGVFSKVLSYVYLYIPLLTMNIVRSFWENTFL